MITTATTTIIKDKRTLRKKLDDLVSGLVLDSLVDEVEGLVRLGSQVSPKEEPKNRVIKTLNIK